MTTATPTKTPSRLKTPAVTKPVSASVAEKEATVAKLLAESRAFDAAAEESLAAAKEHFALAAAAELEQQLTKHKISSAEVDYKAASIGLAQMQRQEKLVSVGDLWRQNYTFDDVVSERSVRQCTTTLQSWARSEPGCDIRLVINTVGGDIIAGFNLIDFLTDLRQRGHKVTTVALGMAASMGAAILQGGDQRVMGKNAVLLLHEGSLDLSGNFGTAEDMMKLMKMFHEQILDLFTERALPLNPKTTKTFLRAAWKRTDFWVSSARALELGLVDAVQ